MRYDLGAAIAGLTFAAVGGLFLMDALDAARFRFELILPGAAIALGAGAILSSILRPREP
jgi:hypothetical protein